jgi:predicted ATPase/DNA-binding winged helix-turn-helix (wHTH) protein
MADTAEPLLLRFDAFELEEREGRLLRDGVPLPLPPKAFGVLCALLRHPGHLLRKDELLDAVWGHQYVSESVLKTVVRDLRSALGDDARQPRFIETASRRGYRFIAPVRPAGVQAGLALPPPAAALAQPHASTLVGREAALARLGQAWQAALSGRRQLLWVAGEAGIGKTTLLDHFAAGLQGAVVARGQCVEQHGAGEPYLPVLEALAVLCREGPAVVAALRSVAPTWLLQLPWLSDEAERAALRTQLAGAGQERMLREMGELLDRLSAVQPLLLVTEDLHWSDLATLRLLDHLARRRTPARLLWLASFRPLDAGAEGHPLKSLRDELRLHGLADELPLAPFSAQEVEDYLRSRLGDAAAPDPGPLSRALHARTEGLPLFVANVVDDVVARSAAAAGGDFGAAVPALLPDNLPVPQSLAGVIGRQAERLAADDRQLLEAASVCGVAFQLETLADLLGCAVEAAAERCDALARRHQWLAGLSVARRHDGALSGSALFRHALYRQVFYERIGAVARLQLHQRVAQSLERQAARGDAIAAAELAHHHEQGGETAAALRCYALAADNALRHFAPADALSLTTQALALLPRCEDTVERHELELALLAPRGMASSQLSGVTAPATRAVFERVDALCELQPRRVPGALSLALGWSLFVAGDYGPALASARRRLAQAEAQDDAAQPPEPAGLGKCG